MMPAKIDGSVDFGLWRKRLLVILVNRRLQKQFAKIDIPTTMSDDEKL